MKPYQKGKHFFACGENVFIAKDDFGETHIYRELDGEKLSTSDMTFGEVYGGGENLDIKSTRVEMRSGFVKLLCGGGMGGNIETVNVELLDGMVGENLYGGGFNDNVKIVEIKVCGGAIKHSIFAAGASKICQNVNIEFNNASCTYLFTGGADLNSEQDGNITVKMLGGNILDLICGGHGKNNGEAEFTVSGGYIEREISVLNFEGNLKLKLYKNLFVSNGLDLTFPHLPKNAYVEFLPEIKKEQLPVFKQSNSKLFDFAKDSLSFLFFELRHPNIPKNASIFPYFIGSCTYVLFPNGENMLIDTGNDYNEAEIFENLQNLGVKHLNYLVITHFHKDHIGTAAKIINNISIDTVILPNIQTVPKEADKPYYDNMICAINKRKLQVLYFSRGMNFSVGEVLIECLNPIPKSSDIMNNCSIVLKFSYKENSAVFGGDIGDKIENEISEIYGKNLKCDLLKISHHGITDQTYYRYIEKCAPSAVVIDSLRENGCFVKTTTYSLINVNGINKESIYVTGKVGMIKAELFGDKKSLKIEHQYEF